MDPLSNNILALLSYIEEVEKLKRKPTYLVPSDIFAAHIADLKGLPELLSNLVEPDGGEVWLRVPRLQEIGPPAVPAHLQDWLTLAKALAKANLRRAEAGEKSITMNALAVQAGVAATTIARLARTDDKAASALSLDLASKIVTVLDCGIEDLLEVVNQ